MGICDRTKSTTTSQQHHTAKDCEVACCNDPNCIAFQYRTKDGCLFSDEDTRLGGEKDGPSGWCDPRAPAMWKGQWIKPKHKRGEEQQPEQFPGACSDSGWKPNELSGQCFGLGSSHKIPTNTAEACRDSCCQDTNCRIWQWRADAGCFYFKNGFNCQEANPLDFEPFVGKRKVQEGRSYTPKAYSGDFSDMAKAR